LDGGPDDANSDAAKPDGASPDGMACGTENGSMVTASEGPACGVLTGTVQPGMPCSQAGDCMPACCSCGSLASGQSVAVAYCNDGVCAGEGNTCCTFLLSEEDVDAAERACQ